MKYVDTQQGRNVHRDNQGAIQSPKRTIIHEQSATEMPRQLPHLSKDKGGGGVYVQQPYYQSREI